MKKNKYVVEKTAAQRKAERRAFEQKKAGVVDPAVAQAKQTKKKRLIAAICVCLGVVVLLSVSLGIIFGVKRFPTDHPYATIKLSNGVELEFELYHDLEPTAVENFISLANNGVYDGTVVHNKNKDMMRLGAYTKYVTTSGTGKDYARVQRRYKDLEDYIKYSYTVRKTDSNGNNFKFYNGGYLSTVATSSYQSEFRICLDGPANQGSEYGKVFGYAVNDTLEKLKKLNDIEVDANFIPKTELKIVSVKIAANSNQWKKYDFTSNHTIDTDYVKYEPTK